MIPPEALLGCSLGPERPIFRLHFLSQERRRGARVVQNGILIWYCATCEAFVTCWARKRVATPVTSRGRVAKFSTGRFASCFGLCGFGNCYRCPNERTGGSVTVGIYSVRQRRLGGRIDGYTVRYWGRLLVRTTERAPNVDVGFPTRSSRRAYVLRMPSFFFKSIPDALVTVHHEPHLVIGAPPARIRDPVEQRPTRVLEGRDLPPDTRWATWISASSVTEVCI